MIEEKYECGPGSSAKKIADILVEWLPPILDKYKILEICDLGCGDLFWFSRIDFRGIYRGYDEVIREAARKRLRNGWELHAADIFTDYIALCDMAIVKDVFIHYGSEEVMELLQRVKDRAKYLLADSHFKHAWPRATTHQKTEDGRRYGCSGNDTDLTNILGKPLEKVEILSEAEGGRHGRKIMGLWDMRKVKL